MGLDLRMKGDTIPDQHHIARLCRPKHISDEKIQASAFMVRVGEESLSVNWLEFLKSSSRENEIAELQNIYSKKFNKVEVRAQIAILNVGEVREKALTESPDRRNLKVLHDPQYGTVNDPSHSGIYNLKHDDELIAELILETVQETYPARK
jgi:hypothetical protein